MGPMVWTCLLSAESGKTSNQKISSFLGFPCWRPYQPKESGTAWHSPNKKDLVVACVGYLGDEFFNPGYMEILWHKPWKGLVFVRCTFCAGNSWKLTTTSAHFFWSPNHRISRWFLHCCVHKNHKRVESRNTCRAPTKARALVDY